ncbi:enoyl-CoA hydratase/isomerase family protein [Galbibacter mesophilus]|uniref:enoyl-CoA hydratase/isomerase family protein n=1 Tax=Galbibacter mesophilus TaxID=379069 RepID=UPI00191FE847|nr:enoyl-CoA hydratase-related protein [Galbibacter mesophilus]MCM5662341.1 enoyl-CoA hydratase-related protein [Galbibacter mesophilus]
MDFENIITEVEDKIGLITINRPNKLNALNKATIEELHHAFIAMDENEDVRAIIITGAGEKAFVAGADIAEFSNFSVYEGSQLAAKGQELLFNLIESLETPVIAAINGFALGGGLELAMACHIRVANDHARMGLPETSLGLIPGYGGTQRLPQLVGKGRAMEMILTAGMIGTEQALMSGLINHMVAQEQLIPFCKKMAGKMINNSPVAISAAINAINASFSGSGYKKEIEAFGECFGTEDFKEGTTAFLEKRKADFPGK